jgi:integrase
MSVDIARVDAVRNRALAARATANEDRDADDQLDPIGLHEARHLCASTLIASGANAKVIQRVMGHASITETFDRYGHLMPGGLAEAAAAANAYLARRTVRVTALATAGSAQ